MSPIDPPALPAGASIVETVAWINCVKRMREVVRLGGCLEVSGDGGTGKTTCVDTFLTAQVGLRIAKIHFESKVRGHALLRRLVESFGGVPRGDTGQMMRDLTDLIGDEPAVVAIDEVESLDRDSLRQIRYLRDQAMRMHEPVPLRIILVGSDFGNAYRLVPELHSRVSCRARFDPLSRASVVVTVRAQHPVLAAAEADLLERIDAEYAFGIWRNWSNVLSTCLDHMQRFGDPVLTERAASSAMATLVGGAPPPLAAMGNARPQTRRGNRGHRRSS